MTTMSRTTVVGQTLRDHVARFMGGMAIPDSTSAGEPPVSREDGVLEFYKHWRVRGNVGQVDGLYATFADNDDVIEFGLLERKNNEATNVMQATLVLADDRGELNVISETKGDLNFDAVVTPDDMSALVVTLRYFGEVFDGREGV